MSSNSTLRLVGHAVAHQIVVGPGTSSLYGRGNGSWLFRLARLVEKAKKSFWRWGSFRIASFSFAPAAAELNWFAFDSSQGDELLRFACQLSRSGKEGRTSRFDYLSLYNFIKTGKEKINLQSSFCRKGVCPRLAEQ